MAIKLTLGLVLADKLSSREEKYYFFSNFLERIYWLVYSHAIGIHGLFIQLAFFFFLLQIFCFSERGCLN